MKQENSKEAPLLSVIIPIYNAEPYLERCLQSVAESEFTDFECILVENGSRDRSLQTCQSFAEKDSRFRVLFCEKKGASCARNFGIDAARGDWIVFVDADDYVGPRYFSDLIEASDGENVLQISDYQPFSPQGEEPRTFPEVFSIAFSKKPAADQEILSRSHHLLQEEDPRQNCPHLQSAQLR